MKPTTIFGLLLAFCVITMHCYGDVVTVLLTNSTGIPGAASYTVPSNTVAQVSHAFVGNTACVSFFVRAGGGVSLYSFPSPVMPTQNLPTVVGPAVIGLTNSDGCNSSLCFFTVQTSPTTATTVSSNLPNSVPSTAVVIPSDTNGPVTIILESSADMVTWVPALPGTYGTTYSNRFFRVRAQR